MCKHVSPEGVRCEGRRFCRGYCATHYWRWKRGTDMDRPTGTRLTPEQIKRLVDCPTGGKKLAALAEQLGISYSYAKKIRSGERNPVKSDVVPQAIPEVRTGTDD